MSPDDRLDSWKEIAAYLKRGVRTAQRWEHTGLPIRRVATDRGVVYAFRSEIDAWWVAQPPRVSLAGGEVPLTGTAASARAPADNANPDPRHRAEGNGMQVRGFLGEAVALDPDVALPHAHLATYFFTLVVIGLTAPDAGLTAARAAARRALDLDPALAEAEAVLAAIAGVQDRDWDDAGGRFEAILRRDPVPPSVRLYYASWYLSPLGRRIEALRELRLAISADPLSLVGRLHVAMELQAMGEFAETAAELERLLEIDSQFGPALGFLGHEYARQGRLDEALGCAERSLSVLPNHPNAVGFMAGLQRRIGQHARSESLLETLAQQRPFAVPRARAECHLVCGEVDEAATWLETAIRHRDPGIWLVLAGTAGVVVRASKHWKALAAQLNIG